MSENQDPNVVQNSDEDGGYLYEDGSEEYSDSDVELSPSAMEERLADSTMDDMREDSIEAEAHLPIDSDDFEMDSDFSDLDDGQSEEEKPSKTSPYGTPYLISLSGERFRYNSTLATRMIRNGDTSLPNRVIVERLVPLSVLNNGFVLVGQSLDGKFVFGIESTLRFDDGRGVWNINNVTPIQTRLIIVNPNDNFREVVSTTHEFTRPVDSVATVMSAKNEICAICTDYRFSEQMHVGIFNFTNNIAFYMSFQTNLIGLDDNKGRCCAVTKDFVVMLCKSFNERQLELKLVIVSVANDESQLPQGLTTIEEVNLENRPPPTSSSKTIVHDVKPINPNKPVNTVHVGVREIPYSAYIKELVKEEIGTNLYLNEDVSADILEINNNIIRLICYVLVKVDHGTRYAQVTIRANVSDGTLTGQVDQLERIPNKYYNLEEFQTGEVISLFPQSYTLPCAAYNAALHRNHSEKSIMPAVKYGGGYEYVDQFTNKEKDYPLLEEKHIRNKSFC
uniref:H/ACA ribonucleoprotein complex non-core subunit NAF1 n=1 Tax=Panagrellus redivivus TaxID=6233 RepID=A0A7E4W7J9_PANRE